MSRYCYAAKTEDGRTVWGRREAESEGQLFSKLREEDLFPVGICCMEGWGVRTAFGKQELSEFCRQTGTMLAAGIPLDVCLKVLAALEGRHRTVYESLLSAIRQGRSLGDAMEQQERVFTPILCRLVRLGENGGHLSSVLKDMGRHFRQEHEMEQKMKLASLYPTLLLVFTAAMVMVIFGFVLPSFFDLFEGMEVPGYTKLLMNFSMLVQNGWQWILAGLCCLLVMAWLLGRFEAVRLWLYKTKAHNRFYRKLHTARFASAMASLYGAGLPMVECLKLCQGITGNQYIDVQIQAMLFNVENGVPLSLAIGRSEGFDPKLKAGVLVGEESGSLKEMLYDISELFQYETDQTMQRLIVLLEPAMILLMAAVIGYVAVAVMVPIYQYYQGLG